ncbi:hypothetical protein RI129_009987 [Pyrocoelia pectoralis]|uniref:Uncharacterized protein n=1 Tax=Pyrocoelia pectoralis TaxID=417401 RepID=A0AAN7V3J4_9COLE
MHRHQSDMLVKTPELAQPVNKRNLYMGGLTFAFLFSSLITSAYIDSNFKLSGLSHTFKIHDTLMLVLSILLLARSFSTENPYLMLPWIIITGWNMYYCQYESLLKILTNGTKMKHLSKMATLTFGLIVLTIVTKIILILRVAILGVEMWYQNHLEQATLKKQN